MCKVTLNSIVLFTTDCVFIYYSSMVHGRTAVLSLSHFASNDCIYKLLIVQCVALN